MILVTGAGGKTGRAVVAALARRQAPVRAWLRHEEQRAELLALGATEVVVGDFLRRQDGVRALAGARAVYHICPNVHEQETEIGLGLLAAARAASCRHFVYHSVLHPQIEAMAHHWLKLRVEEALFESGIPFTILQPASYLQNVLAAHRALARIGLLQVPYDPAAPFSPVDLADVAEAAARILTEPGHEGATYELCGPRVVTTHDLAAILTEILGRPVQAQRLTLSAWRDAARQKKLDSYGLRTLEQMFRYYDRCGFWGSPAVLGLLLGRPPTGPRAGLRRLWQELEGPAGTAETEPSPSPDP
jgi:uncharacterized protein YbjT (DUF2867 family)